MSECDHYQYGPRFWIAPLLAIDLWTWHPDIRPRRRTFPAIRQSSGKEHYGQFLTSLPFSGSVAEEWLPPSLIYRPLAQLVGWESPPERYEEEGAIGD